MKIAVGVFGKELVYFWMGAHTLRRVLLGLATSFLIKKIIKTGLYALLLTLL